MALTIEQVTIDSNDPDKLARFWQEALRYKHLDRWVDGDMIGVEIAPADGNGDTLQFLSNAEPKSVKNRWHLDLRPEDQAAEVARLESLGATKGM